MFHTTHLRKALVLASGLVGLTALSTPAVHAEDGKVYPASMCQGALVGNPPYISYTGESVRNTSSTYSAVVVCSGIKDNVLGTAGLNEAHVRYRKANSNAFFCDLHSMNSFATAEYVQFKSDNGAAGFKQLSFTPISSVAQGHYTLICAIPPSATSTKSEIFSYRIDEN